MHIGYTGPKILNLDKEGMPVQPYGVKDNPYSILDVADIVYVIRWILDIPEWWKIKREKIQTEVNFLESMPT